MIPGFTNGSEGLHNLYGNWTQEDDVVSSSLPPPEDTHSTSLLYNLSLLFDKCHQVQSNLRTFISPSQPPHPPESAPVAIANMGTLIQEIIITASSMMFTCQQMALGATLGDTNTTTTTHDDQLQQQQQEHHQVDDWYGDGYNICNNNELDDPKSNIYDIIELDAADLLAKYTHYCQVCGKGFKRDANLRMHMRAHGDEYKSTAALINPMKNNDAANGDGAMKSSRKKYSCPQEGCRWNRRHAKFQPLKSMICVKNHYKRSHCPKMYVCKRCNVKQFSVLSDLRTHEKHCGDLRWQCSCGTTFSRKDKLLGHVALFVGHTPAVNSLRN